MAKTCLKGKKQGEGGARIIIMSKSLGVEMEKLREQWSLKDDGWREQKEELVYGRQRGTEICLD